MTNVEVVKTEYMTGKLDADYGSKTRVVMRSPKALLFVGYGLNIISRPIGRCDRRERISDKLNIAALQSEHVIAALIRFFGDDGPAAALLALEKKGMGTVLLDGGGDPMPLPEAVTRDAKMADYAATTPSKTIIPENAKTCQQCGGALPLHTVSHHLSPDMSVNTAKTLEDVQRLSNNQVVRIFGVDINQDRKYWSLISSFDTWDGESYRDDTFCSDRCAANYGRRAAAELPKLQPGIEPVAVPKFTYESKHHYDVAEQERKNWEAIKKLFERIRKET
jgi:hypothetical protein